MLRKTWFHARLDGTGYGYAGQWRGLFSREDGEGDGPEAVVVCSFGVVE